MIARAAALALLLAATAVAARADPCEAIPERGPMPADLAPGARFAGRVTYVGDGDSLCVARGPGPADWVEVRLEDFFAPELQAPGGPEARAALRRLVFGRQLACRAAKRSWDRVVATCWRDGVSVGTLMRQAGIAEGGRGR
jgi:endonuclease YncB( thermonuclease family)